MDAKRPAWRLAEGHCTTVMRANRRPSYNKVYIHHFIYAVLSLLWTASTNQASALRLCVRHIPSR